MACKSPIHKNKENIMQNIELLPNLHRLFHFEIYFSSFSVLQYMAKIKPSMNGINKV